jgi:hypothetical protein
MRGRYEEHEGEEIKKCMRGKKYKMHVFSNFSIQSPNLYMKKMI